MLGKKYIFILILLSGIFCSCNDGAFDNDIGSDFNSQENCISINISTGSLTSRADVLPEIENRENAIKRVQLFFFKNTQEEDTDYKTKTDNFVMRKDYDDLYAKNKSQHIIKLNQDEIEEYFGTESDPKSLIVYAVVNYLPTTHNGSQTTWLPAGENTGFTQVTPTIEMIEQWGLGRAFNNDEKFKETENRYDIIPSQFVMMGSEIIKLNRETRRANAIVEVKRVAAKIRLGVNVEKVVSGSLDIEEKYYVPDLTNITAAIANGFNIGRMDGQPADANSRYITDQTGYDENGKAFPIAPDGSLLKDDGDPKTVSQVKTTDEINKDVDYFSSTETTTRKISAYEGSSLDESTLWNERPFYTYPHSWNPTLAGEHNTSIVLQVPWLERDAEGARPINTYYRVTVNSKENKLEANHYYRMIINVKQMGSLDPGDPVEIKNVSTEVLPWQKAESTVSMDVTRFLVCNQTEFVLNNQETVAIPFISSHPVTWDEMSVSIKFNRFNDNFDRREYDGEPNPQEIGYTQYKETKDRTGEELYSFEVKDNTLIFTHPLTQWTGRYINNRGVETNYPYTTRGGVPTWYVKGEGEAYWPYDITITIYHKDQNVNNTRYKQEIHIIQYPAMYIEPQYNKNIGDGTQYASNNGSSTVNSGNVWVMGNYIWPRESYWYTPRGLGGGNTNPNMYLIHISKLSANEDMMYEIGDPRSLTAMTSDDLYKLQSDKQTMPSAVGIENGIERSIINYYPTDDASGPGSKEYYIAPVIRIASSHGVSTTMTKESAINRCATYQEDRYPAGRWRLPTRAELKYIYGLSAAGKLPELFSTGTYYWTANGAYRSTDGFTSPSTNNTNVRCVYDEWYWSQSDYPLIQADPVTQPNNNNNNINAATTVNYQINRTRIPYTFGDAVKDNPQEQPGNQP